MTSIFRPRNDLRRSSRFLGLGSPFIIDEYDDYPDGINAFIDGRAKGQIAGGPDARNLVKQNAPGESAILQLAGSLADLLRWGATERAHSALGRVRWHEIKAWHIEELYKDALLQGYWTQQFFETGEKRPLSPEYIRTKLSHIYGCYTWMAANGYINGFDYQPSYVQVKRDKDSAILSFRKEQSFIEVASVGGLPRKYRVAPSDLLLPTLPHLLDFFGAIRGKASRLAGLLLFETGIRASEAIENTLIPGVLHDRSRSAARSWFTHPDWTEGTCILEHSMDDNRMIGVIPTEMSAWNADARPGYQCDYRILGKNKVVRVVHVPPKILRAIWAYINGERTQLAMERRVRGKPDAPNVFLNRFGDRLEYHALWSAFDDANARVKGPFHITPHLLRHAYACYFLEVALAEEARRRGYEVDAMPMAFITEYGQTVLLTIQRELGHKEFATTSRYLTQVQSGRVGMNLRATWNAFLDGWEGSDGE